MTTIYIHIGAPKTATSTLQALLVRKAKKLAKSGVLYPSAPRHGDAHHVLVCDLIEKHQGNHMPDFWYGDFPRGQAWNKLADEIAGHGKALESVVISSELFFGQSRQLRPMLADIGEHLAGYTVKIVSYLRRQDQLYSSFFNQDVKGARQWADGPYQFYETHQIFQHHYVDLLSIWGDFFGEENIIVRPYEPAQWREEDIVADFCDAIDAPRLKAGSLESNASLGPNQLYAKQCLNKIGYDKAINDDVVRRLIKLLPEEPIKNSRYVHAGLYSRYKDSWEASNKRLSDKFLQGKSLFQQTIPDAHDLEPYSVDDEVLAKYLQGLVKQLAREKTAEMKQLFAHSAFLMLAERKLWPSLNEKQLEALLSWS
ncbi:MAG: hypothetical protein ABJK25_11100 [Halieaceae bacterium]